MKDLTVYYYAASTGANSPIEHIDYEIPLLAIPEWLEAFASDYWEAESDPGYHDTIYIMDTDNNVIKSIKYGDRIKDDSENGAYHGM